MIKLDCVRWKVNWELPTHTETGELIGYDETDRLMRLDPSYIVMLNVDKMPQFYHLRNFQLSD